MSVGPLQSQLQLLSISDMIRPEFASSVYIEGNFNRISGVRSRVEEIKAPFTLCRCKMKTVQYRSVLPYRLHLNVFDSGVKLLLLSKRCAKKTLQNVPV